MKNHSKPNPPVWIDDELELQSLIEHISYYE